MNVNEDIWGVPYTEYDTMNNRTGAADLNDPDFEDFPPFVKNDMRTNGVSNGFLSNETLYIGYLNNPTQFDFLKPMDFSIAYCGCKNPDLGINNIGVPIPSQYDPYQSDISPANAFRFKSKPNTPQPIAFLNSYGFMHDLTTTVSVGQFSNPYYMQSVLLSAQTKYVPNGNNNNGGFDTQAHINSSNRNLFFSYWRDFGLRCLFGTIMVTYFDGTYNATTGVPQNVATKSLYWFESQTDEFKNSHRILGAFLRVNFRRSTAGLYNATTPQSQCFVADFSGNLFADENIWGNQYPLQQWQPCSAYVRNTGSYLPLFGPANLGQTINTRTGYVSWVSQPSTGGTSQYSGLLLGINTELSFLSYGHGLATNDTGRRAYWIEMDYTEESAEYIRKCAAAYGLFFTDGESSETGYADLYAAGHDDDRWTNTNMCLGVVDNEGYTDGTYTRGTGNEGANNFLWKTASESKYDPSRPPPVGPDPTQYSDETGFNVLGGVANCNKVYAVNASNIMNLAKALSTAITTRLSDLPPLDYSLETFLTNNPLDCVISLRKYPVKNLSTGTEEPISFGSYQNANVQGIPFVKSYDLITFTFSNAARNSLYPHFSDFRDYEPYTHAELIVPFCGTVQINPCDFIGHDINVYMVVDYITGGCTAYVAADRLVVTSIAGTIGVDVPLSGIQTATLESQRVNAVMSRKSADIGVNNAIVGGLSSSVGLLASAGAGSVVGAVGSGAGLVSSVGRIEQADIAYQKADYELKHQQVPFKQVSAGTPIASTVIENCCRLIIYRPILDDRYNAEVYAKTVGFACLMNGKVSDFTGFTVGNINVDGLAITDTEKQAIQKAFANGVIL